MTQDSYLISPCQSILISNYNNIPLCMCVCVCMYVYTHIFFICPSFYRHLDCLHVLAILNNAAGTWSADISLKQWFHFLWMYTQKFIAGSYGSSIFNLLRNCHTVFHSGYTSLNSLQQCTRIPFSPHSHQNIFSLVFDSSHSNKGEVILILVWVCISLMISDIEHVFTQLLAICIYIFFGKKCNLGCSLLILQYDYLFFSLFFFAII